jgi:membrane-bound lytic murein transglycosylase D
VPREAAPQEAVPREAVPREAVPREAVPREAVPHEAVPPPALGREVLEGLLAVVHGHGGIESPELADLLDEEAAQLARGGAACVPGTAGCELASTSHELAVAPGPSRAQTSVAAAAERGSWLDGLELPAIGVKEEPHVREIFEFFTRNAVGRETFQELLFRCASYRELVYSALERYGLSPELLAVPMVVSGCMPDAESSDGGRGLWQLTSAAAKGYRLRVKALVLDERLDPAKSTDAAVRLLEDLFRKTGSWDLALAAYRIGPLALVARLAAGGNTAGGNAAGGNAAASNTAANNTAASNTAAEDGADYWELAAGGRLPEAAVKFVPKVQAFALILANLSRFRFEPLPQRPAESTTTLEVPPGTRLGLVARAAASSTTKIRALNPDVLGDRLPDWPGQRFLLRVPKETGERAREALPTLLASADHADECVPHAFDWGRQRFTTAMASRCELTNGTGR